MTLSKSLPAWTYTSNEFFELEKNSLFLCNWQVICHTSNIPNIGDYFTLNLFHERILVIKGNDNVIRAFHNVCSHRATKLIDKNSGNCKKRISCPYHAWGYDLQGSLIKVPHQDEFKELDKSQHGLKPIEMEIFQGFIFVKLISTDGPSVANQFNPYLEEIKPYRFEELEPLGRVTMRHRSVNWKQIADNYVDALHIPVAHPGLSALVGKSYGLEVSSNDGLIHKMWGDGRKIRKNNLSNKLYDKFLPKIEHLDEDKQRFWLYYRMWPNLAFDVYPEQMDFMQFIPLNSTTTMIREIPYALPDHKKEMKAARYLNWRINRQVNKEDTKLINLVQEGMSTSGFVTGPLAESEICLIDSANKIRKYIPVSNIDEKPNEEFISKINSDLLIKN
jgi:phenylpropionate dioxygenase-like ring-hydroxylating dioxygenase large terminal subunit